MTRPRAAAICPQPGCPNDQPCPAHTHQWAPAEHRRPGVLTGRRRQTRNKRIMAAHGHRCYQCGAPATQIDHVHPVAEGGTDAPANLAPICDPCHTTKTQAEARRGRASTR